MGVDVRTVQPEPFDAVPDRPWARLQSVAKGVRLTPASPNGPIAQRTERRVSTSGRREFESS